MGARGLQGQSLLEGLGEGSVSRGGTSSQPGFSLQGGLGGGRLWCTPLGPLQRWASGM